MKNKKKGMTLGKRAFVDGEKCSPIQVFVKDGGHYLSKSRRLEHIQLAKSLYVTNRRYFQKRKLVIDYPIYIT